MKSLNQNELKPLVYGKPVGGGRPQRFQDSIQVLGYKLSDVFSINKNKQCRKVDFAGKHFS